MMIASHRRSGTHLLINTFFLSFGRLSRWRYKLLKTHGLAGEIKDGTARVEVAEARRLTLLDNYPSQPIVCIVRDVRDTLASSYRWWRESGESRFSLIADTFKDISPAEYIHGKCTLKAVPSPGRGCGVTDAHVKRGILSNPAAFWADHASSYLDSAATVVRFEDLLTQPEEVMTRVANTFGLRAPRHVRLPQVLVGHSPGKGVIGGHADVFDPVTLETILQKAGPTMQRLGYL